MSKIQQRLDSLQPYINGIRYVQGMQIVDAMFKEGWTVPDSKIIRKELVDKSQNYYMFFSENEDITFDDLLDYIQNIIKINIERENKNILFKDKVKELQIIFKENNLNKLQKLEYVFSDELDKSSIMDVGINDNFNNEFNSEIDIKPENEVKLSDNIVEEPKSKVLESRTITANGQNIELPPKKVVLEDYSIPDEQKIGDCSCGENEACNKCLDDK